ncbi:hypothetical protein [Cryobacterium sp. HLT2-28]|uniref:hypothetical protein n=1 Tax=Cryobacterium sp. HLT2-28 TaxID=1259146 RepID=UPI00106A46E6|nr:hypothetical protein [Cryobacterium sp. HLT2-28]TFB96990.1 hypothetical protein E3O48_04790 [Cryobacterium sp. HLT2-28]
MRVLLKEILDCSPDAAWRALRSPAVFREVSSPVVSVESLEAGGFPTVWEPGEHPVGLNALGLLPMGEQVIRLTMETTRKDGVRILRDTGRGVSGALASVTLWDHRMAVAADPAGTGKTLFRDQLIFRTGALTLASWPVFWALWQWRMHQLRRLAPTWRLDLGVDLPADAGASASETAAADASAGTVSGADSAAVSGVTE